MDWSGVVTAIPDAIKSVFATIDKLIPDATERDKMKLSILQGVMGTGSSHWLQANAFSVAMLCNYGMVVALTLMGKTVPEWSIVVALAWLAGPLLNGLSKDTIGKLMEMAKSNKEEKK